MKESNNVLYIKFRLALCKLDLQKELALADAVSLQYEKWRVMRGMSGD